MKRLPFVNRRSDRRGVHHSVENGIYKGKGLDLGAEPPCIKLC